MASVFESVPEGMSGLPVFASKLPDGSVDWWPSRKAASHKAGRERFKAFAAWLQNNGSMADQVDALESVLYAMFDKDGAMESGFIEALAEAAIDGYRQPGAKDKLTPYLKKSGRSLYWGFLSPTHHLDYAAAVLGASGGK